MDAAKAPCYIAASFWGRVRGRRAAVPPVRDFADLTQLEALPEAGAGPGIDVPARASRLDQAIADLLEGWKLNWLWTRLAHQDLRLRYRGSVIGPFWQTLTTGIMIGGMGFIYSKLFHSEMKDYLPLLATGLIFWQLVAALITEGTGTFDAVRSVIQQVKLPFFLHAFRLVYRNLLIFAHSFVIIPIVVLVYPHPIQPWRLLEVIPGVALVALNGIALSVLLGTLCARFRDVPQIVANIVQVVFFMTPIVFPASALGENQWLATINPLYAAIDVMRAPILGQPTGPHSWTILLTITVVNWVVGFLFFARFRARIAYWV
jgi:ABC-2 type transport system permease protein/lipopolysaccharide transport system permease protein